MFSNIHHLHKTNRKLVKSSGWNIATTEGVADDFKRTSYVDDTNCIDTIYEWGINVVQLIHNTMYIYQNTWAEV